MFLYFTLANKNISDMLHGMIQILDCCKFIMPPTLKKLMGHIAFGAYGGGCVGACVGGSHFLYLL